jgi:DNA topoisomerase-3
VFLGKGRVITKKTTPPLPYTEATLLGDMASIAKYVKDPHVKAALLKKDANTRGEHGGIGTTATRAAVLSALYERGFLTTEGSKVTSTSLGREVYALIPDGIKGADITAKWWMLAQDVREGKADAYAIQRSVVEVFNAHRDSAYVGAVLNNASGKPIGSCPVCGEALIAYRTLCSCASNVRRRQDDGSWAQVSGCGFKLFYTAFGTALGKAELKELIERGKTTTKVKGLKGRSGKVFEARLALEQGTDDKLTGRVVAVFDTAPTMRKAS